jgi:glutathione S-transferase
MKFKLYYSPGACSLAPHIVLKEIGIPFEVELVSTSDSTTSTEKYLSINSKGRVPALDIGDSTLTEVSAIMTYLALLHPKSDLISKKPLEMARTIEWMNWLATIHATVIAQNWRAERFSDNVDSYSDIQAKGFEELKKVSSDIDKKLRLNEWAIGNKYSIADPYLLVLYRWGNRIGVDMSQFANSTSHAKKMEMRNAVSSVLEFEGISIWK